VVDRRSPSGFRGLEVAWERGRPRVRKGAERTRSPKTPGFVVWGFLAGRYPKAECCWLNRTPWTAGHLLSDVHPRSPAVMVGIECPKTSRRLSRKGQWSRRSRVAGGGAGGEGRHPVARLSPVDFALSSYLNFWVFLSPVSRFESLTAHQGFQALTATPSRTHGRVGSPGDSRAIRFALPVNRRPGLDPNAPRGPIWWGVAVKKFISA
jgi:hypothetical protein